MGAPSFAQSVQASNVVVWGLPNLMVNRPAVGSRPRKLKMLTIMTIGPVYDTRYGLGAKGFIYVVPFIRHNSLKR